MGAVLALLQISVHHFSFGRQMIWENSPCMSKIKTLMILDGLSILLFLIPMTVFANGPIFEIGS